MVGALLLYIVRRQCPCAIPHVPACPETSASTTLALCDRRGASLATDIEPCPVSHRRANCTTTTTSSSAPVGQSDAPAPSLTSTHALGSLPAPPSSRLTAVPANIQRKSGPCPLTPTGEEYQHHHLPAPPPAPTGQNDAPAPSLTSLHTLGPLPAPPSPRLNALTANIQRKSGTCPLTPKYPGYQHHHLTASPSAPADQNGAPVPSPTSLHVLGPLPAPPSPWLSALIANFQRKTA